jgi:hypothetical protein
MTKINKKNQRNSKKFIDSDQDGLSDWEEKNVYGSDPHDEDTDGDGVDDGEAVIKGMNPATGEKFKDFFIPNKKNNYQPKSLHSKRILFHAGAAIVIKLVVVFFIVSYPLTAWMTPDLIAEQGRKIIVLTNELRKELSLPVLKENTKLDQAAYAKVQDMFLGQYFAHTSPANKNLETFLKQVAYNFSTAGENLAMGFDNSEDVMAAWKKSPTHYANLSDENFQEIGVGIAEDIFEGGNTVFTAQYFGRPQNITVNITPKEEVTEVDEPSVEVESSSKIVLSAREDSNLATSTKVTEIATSSLVTSNIDINPESTSTVATNTLVVAATTTASVIIDQPVGKPESLVKVEAVLPADTKEASAMVLNSNIPLAQTDNGDWQGQQIIYDKNVGPVVPASITAVDNSGNKNVSDLATENIKPKETSLAEQYALLRSNPNNAMQKIFNISSIYFKIILFLAIISLLLSIFVQIKKQHPKIIMSGLGLIVFLIILIVI